MMPAVRSPDSTVSRARASVNLPDHRCTLRNCRIRDRIRILHDGLVLLDTGCVSGRATRMLNFSGLASFVSVEVLPNCSGTTSGTAWNYTLACPGS